MEIRETVSNLYVNDGRLASLGAAGAAGNDQAQKIYPTLPQVEPVKQASEAALPSEARQTLPNAPNYYSSIARANARHRACEAGDGGHSYRLKKISEIQVYLEQERDKRASLAKKYQRGVNVLSGLCYGFDLASAGLGIAGLSLLTTIVAAPVVIVMEGVAIATGGLGVTGNLICDKVLSVKSRKHLQIKMLAESKLNTISDHISRALKDDEISDEEYSLVLGELEKFNEMKEEIRKNTKSKVDKETKESLIRQGKEQAINEFKNMFGEQRQK